MKKNDIQNVISNCTFVGVAYDKSTLEIILEVAKGLTNLTELFKAQNVKIECMLNLADKQEDKK